MNPFIFCPICSDVKLEIEQVESGDIYLQCPYQPEKWHLAGDCGEKAHWIGEADGYADGKPACDVWYCSNCDYCYDGDKKPNWNYCPNCGVRMR